MQVPEHGKISRPEELVGKTVATSFVALTRQYFAKLEGQQKAVTNGHSTEGEKLRTNIIALSGSVETAYKLGVADGIVDLVGECLERG